MRHKLAADPPWPGNVKIKVTSDGTSEGTRVLAVDSNGVEHPVEGVTGVAWRLGLNYGDELGRLTLSLLASPAEIETDLAPDVVLESPEVE